MVAEAAVILCKNMKIAILALTQTLILALTLVLIQPKLKT